MLTALTHQHTESEQSDDLTRFQNVFEAAYLLLQHFRIYVVNVTVINREHSEIATISVKNLILTMWCLSLDMS